MSAICQNFVQNAWKKELCSNCFKSKDEHLQNAIKELLPAKTTKSVESIIKTCKKSNKRGVSFTNKIAEVIGYGGEVWSDNEDEFELNDDPSEDSCSDQDEDEEEQQIKKLTKMNTDFNTVNANLLCETPEMKKSYTHLKLGTPQIDAEGKKQTLLVSVTPFGQKTKISKIASHIPIVKNSKETVVDSKSSAVLTSYKNKENVCGKGEKSLLEEISETLEKSRTPIQIISRKKNQGKQPDLVVNKENVNLEEDKSKSTLERKTAISRGPVIKKDQEKPAIYQTSTAKIELIALKTNRLKSDDSKNCTENQIEECINKNVETPSKFALADSCNNDTTTDSDGGDESSTNTSNSLTESLIVEQEQEVEKVSVELIPTREQVGEPDGHADPDGTMEPPALPTTPPPDLETRMSFLHASEKPKLPTKPSTVLIRKPPIATNNHENFMQSLSTFSIEAKIKLEKRDSNDSDPGKIANKRKAPMPPPSQNEEIRAERSLRDSLPIISVPEPAPRKSLSFSTDSLTTIGEEKRPKSKNRFSLKRFLRINSNKDLSKCTDARYEEVRNFEPQPKPRLVIVHPLELNGAKVEVLSKTQDQVDYCYENEITIRSAKPPPPPRNLDGCNRPKQNLPHPPKSNEVLNKQRNYENSIYKKKEDSVYANIGEVRSAITPNKPQRTASMREREALEAKKNKHLNDYEPINVPGKENVYDYINVARSSSPECDSQKTNSLYKNHSAQRAFKQARSNSSIDVSGDNSKYQNIPRSASLTYCGSETESEIYSPYSFCGSESEVADDDYEWTSNGRTHKLRSRKGRSIVHKNLEDNYGAVVVANHEALAQVLENIQHGPIVQPALRGLKTTSNLRWTDFSIKESTQPLILGLRIFYQALWNGYPVSLLIINGSIPTSSLCLGSFNLVPITEFSDLIPVHYFPNHQENENVKQIQATIAVLPWLQINTLQTYGEVLKSKKIVSQDEAFRDALFVLLQLINSLKVLQAQGIEELPLSLTSFIVCKEMEKESNYRLCVLQGLAEEMSHQKDIKFGSLCLCATNALMYLLPISPLTPFLRSLLDTERAVSLSQVKAVLEYSLWGPSDVPLSGNIKERELALQRWLDLQRATVLHGLVCARIHLTVYEECHLLFLVRTNVKMMCDASILLEATNKKSKFQTEAIS